MVPSVTPRVGSALGAIVPGLTRLRRYDRSWLRGDLLAGVTVAAYLIPQVMAYAQIAGVPAAAGIWAAVAALVVYAVFGSSPQLSVGPESTTALMTAVALGGLAIADATKYVVYAALLAVLVGLLCIAAGAARLGFVAELLSRPVLVGYMGGIAALMVVSQLGHLTGITVSGGSAREVLLQFGTHLHELQGTTAMLSAVVLSLLLLAHWKVPWLPGPLLFLLLAAAAVAVFDLERRGVEVVGPISSALPEVRMPAFDHHVLVLLFPAAVSVALVGFTDNVLTARAFAGRHGDPIRPNQELLALGVANLAAGVAQGFPVSSSGSRTALAAAAGSRSQLYSLAAVATVLVTVTLAAPVLAAIPVAALGAVVVYAATRLLDVPALRRMAAFRRTELALCVITAGGVVAFGPLTGVLVAVGLSVVDLLHRVARPHDGILGFVPGVAGMHDVDDYPTAEPVAGLVVYRYDSPMFFANAEDFLRRALVAVDRSPTPVEWLILNAEANVTIDITGLDALTDLDDELRRRGIVLALARVKHELRQDLERGGFIARIGDEHVFMTLPTAVSAYADWYRDRHDVPPAGFSDV
ncbi:MAG: sulfate permease [Knoellia sp.]